MKQPDAIAIIPARGRSKGIPGKNIRAFCGKPLIAWTIEAALATEHVGRVVVSTDAEDIAAVAKDFGAEVVMRPAELSGDLSPSEEALLHALETLYPAGADQPRVLAFLQCTSPLVTAADIDGTIDKITDEACDTAITVADFHYFIWGEDETGSLAPVNHAGTQRLMRQERAPQVIEVGAVYAMDCAGFREHRFRFFGKLGGHPIPLSRAFEIDTEDDWLVGEALMLARTGDRPGLDGLPLSACKAIVTDFDGVLTDNRVWTNHEGAEWVGCNRSDGWGIRRLTESGRPVVCLSSETNPVVGRRCEKLGIRAVTGHRHKQDAFLQICSDLDLAPQQVIYVGNDINDVDCMDLAGVAITPADANAVALEHAHAHTRARGGEGVLREIAEAILGRDGLQQEEP